MKMYTRILFISLLMIFIVSSVSAQEIKLEKLFDLNFILNPPTMAGTKIIYTATGGTVSGLINGKILPVGGDFGEFMNDSTFRIDVRIAIETDDHETIYITYQGYVFADVATSKIIAAGDGDKLDPSKYYFRTNSYFSNKRFKI